MTTELNLPNLSHAAEGGETKDMRARGKTMEPFLPCSPEFSRGPPPDKCLIDSHLINNGHISSLSIWQIRLLRTILPLKILGNFFFPKQEHFLKYQGGEEWGNKWEPRDGSRTTRLPFSWGPLSIQANFGFHSDDFPGNRQDLLKSGLSSPQKAGVSKGDTLRLRVS